MINEGPSHTWNIVLAAGEGRRLAPLTRALYGVDLPKQFAALDGECSLLQATIARISRLAPPERTVVVVAEAHAGLARRQLAGTPGIDVVAQPENLDTGPGLLLPLARVLARDPEARVAVFPSDHHFEHPGVLRRAVGRALAAVPAGRIALLGAVADRPETEYGWIIPGGRLENAGLHRVRRFVEKPAAETAGRLLDEGGLWNTFILVGRARDFWRLALRHLPFHARLFDHYIPVVDRDGQEEMLRAIYGAIPAANFSRALLERAPEDLVVLPVRDSGWCDWGAPERVLRTLPPAGRIALQRRLEASSLPVAAVA